MSAVDKSRSVAARPETIALGALIQRHARAVLARWKLNAGLALMKMGKALFVSGLAAARPRRPGRSMIPDAGTKAGRP